MSGSKVNCTARKLSAFCSLCLLVSANTDKCSDYHPANCTFTGDSCGWDNSGWDRNTGEGYMHLDSHSGYLRSGKACEIPKDTSYCLKFQFYLAPYLENNMTVSILHLSGSEWIPTKLWNHSGGTGKWKEKAMPITSALPYELEFRAWQQVQSPEAAIDAPSLDNITFTKSPCPQPPSSANPSITSAATTPSPSTTATTPVLASAPTPSTPRRRDKTTIIRIISGVAFAVILVSGTAVICLLRRRRRQRFCKTRCCAAERNKPDANDLTSAAHLDVPTNPRPEGLSFSAGKRSGTEDTGRAVFFTITPSASASQCAQSNFSNRRTRGRGGTTGKNVYHILEVTPETGLDHPMPRSLYHVGEGNEPLTLTGHRKDTWDKAVGDESGKKEKKKRSPDGENGGDGVYKHLGDVIPEVHSLAALRGNELAEGRGAGRDREGVFDHLGDGGEGGYCHVDLEKTKRTVVIDEVYSHLK